MDGITHGTPEQPRASTTNNPQSPSSGSVIFSGTHNFHVRGGDFKAVTRNDAPTQAVPSCPTPSPGSGSAIFENTHHFVVHGGNFNSKTRNYAPDPTVSSSSNAESTSLRGSSIVLDSDDCYVYAGTVTSVRGNYAPHHSSSVQSSPVEPTKRSLTKVKRIAGMKAKHGSGTRGRKLRASLVRRM
ncbi:hypothetical protein C8R44DRAFT_855490 [Mycena epipterygia]|nr:hypothetical protein C8R44DRAFT_855490 [Mycena epipterygia]